MSLPGAPSERPIVRGIRRRVQAALSLTLHPPYTWLSIRSDGGAWVLDQEASELHRVALSLGLRARLGYSLHPRAAQCCHYCSQFVLERAEVFSTRQRVSLDYFHGRPELGPHFRAAYEGLKRHHPAITRLRVSHTEMESLVLEAGVGAGKVKRIPIGVRLDLFPERSPESRRAARHEIGLPLTAVVVGSFQKDGTGWGAGDEPKLIKGPDVFVDAMSALRARVPELLVLLVGPARGYVRRRLQDAGIPFVHHVVADYARMSACYHALDAYVVSSRDEGGPKAVLEAMASGVPLVTTRVGQARDLVRDGENGLTAEIEDAEGLADATQRALSDEALRQRLLTAGRATANANSYDAQRPLWADFFRGYVEGP